MSDVSRAIAYGTIHLNPVFVQSNKPRRFKNTTIRVSGADIFWSVVVLIPSALLLLLVGWILGNIPFVKDFIGWWIVILAPFVAVFLGRILSVSMNPYAKTSGEGLGEFLSVFRENTVDVLVWKLRGQRIVYQTVESTVSGRRKKVPGEVWIGTARSQHPATIPNVIGGTVYLDFEPQSVSTNWTEVARDRRRLRKARSVLSK